MQSERSGKQADLSAAASGYGGYCPEGIPVETAIFGILGAFGVAFGVLYRAVTIKTGGRRKRRDTKDEVVSPLDKISDFFWMGMFIFMLTIFVIVLHKVVLFGRRTTLY